MIESLSPIVLFGFNRATSLQKTIESLKKCELSNESEIYIYIDGPRNENEALLVEETKKVVRETTGFKNIEYKFSEKNNGLGESLINGISYVINKHGKVIILEDDLQFHSSFLIYMNNALSLYCENKSIFSICGYSNKIKVPENYKYDSYFCNRSSSWGWGTWKDRWETVDWDLKDWTQLKKLKSDFNKWGGSDCFRMLYNVKYGKNNSWAIRFCFSQFLQKKISLFPTKTLVINNGFDGNGSNCKKYSRFKYDLLENSKVPNNFPEEIIIRKEIFKSAMRYNSIQIRIWSKLMYYIYK